MFTAGEFCEMLDMPVQVQRRLEELEKTFDFEAVHAELSALNGPDTWRDARNALRQKLGEDPDGYRMLLCMLRSMNGTYAYYMERKIPKQIFTDTMKCFSRFVKEHMASFGRYGFDRDFWTGRQLSGLLYRIGALEFELTRDVVPDSGQGVESEKAVRSGEEEELISIHIPSDAVMTVENCEESFRLADDFFRNYFPGRADNRYVCSSWLLSPALRELLSRQSNIVQFQNRFEIVSWNKDSQEFMSWVYKRNDSALAELPEDTSLQRNMKAYLLAGGKVGEGYGILRRKKGE